jgi:hypothetical protein
LKLPVMRVLESRLAESEKLSEMCSLSNISYNFDLRLYWTGITLRGLLGIATSHILTLRKSLAARYL